MVRRFVFRFSAALSVALLAAALFSGSDRAVATQGQAILAGSHDTTETDGTVLRNTQFFPDPTPCGALYVQSGFGACGYTGIKALGQAWGVNAVATGVGGVNNGIGVFGEGTGTGVQGLGSQDGATGVYGSNGAPTGIGVEGTVAGVGSAVYGNATGNGVGVFGDTTDGTGVIARSTNGPALNVMGRAQFSRSGAAIVKATKNQVRVSNVALSSASFVLATMQGNIAGTWVRGVTTNPLTSSLTIFLNQTVASNTKVAWFVVN